MRTRIHECADWLADTYLNRPVATSALFLATAVALVTMAFGINPTTTASEPEAWVAVECVEGCTYGVVRDTAFPSAPLVAVPAGIDLTAGPVPVWADGTSLSLQAPTGYTAWQVLALLLLLIAGATFTGIGVSMAVNAWLYRNGEVTPVW